MKHDLRKQREFSRAEQRQWVSHYRRSAMGLRQFAQQHRLRFGQLHYWVYHKRRSAAVSVSAPTFAEVKWSSLMPAAWAAEVALNEGTTLRVGAGASPQWVGQLAKELRSAC